MYQWSQLKKSLLPTADQALKAMSRADDENPLSRDQRNLMSALMRLPRAIPRIGGNLQTRKTALTAFSWQIVSDDPNLTDDAARCAMRVRSAVQQLLGWHTDVPAFGAACYRLRADASAIGMHLVIDKRYAPTEIDRPPGASSISDLLLLQPGAQRITQSLASLMEQAPQSYLADMDDNHDPGGTLRSLLLKGITAVLLEKEWTQTAQKVKGIIEAVFVPDASPEEVSAAVSAIQDAVTKNITSHSSDIAVNLKDIANSGAAVNTFNLFLQALNSEFSIALLGQANTTQLPNQGGSRAALQIMQMITADIMYADLTRMEAMINKLVLFDYQLNKDRAALSAPWVFKFVVPEEVNLQARAQTIQTLLASNVPLLASEVYQSVGFTKPEGVPEILTNQVSLTDPSVM